MILLSSLWGARTRMDSLEEKGSFSHKQPESTITHQHTMEDGWYVDRKHFLIIFLSHTNHSG